MEDLYSLLKLPNDTRFEQRVLSIKQAIRYLEKFHEKVQGDGASQTWSAIASTFSGLISITIFPTLSPVVGTVLVGGALASGIASIATAATAMSDTRKIDEKIGLFLAVFKSTSPDQWARLWEKTGDPQIFLDAVERATDNGYIDTIGAFRYHGGSCEHPFDVANDWALAGLEAAKELSSIPPASNTVGSHTRLNAIDVQSETDDWMDDETISQPVLPTNNVLSSVRDACGGSQSDLRETLQQSTDRAIEISPTRAVRSAFTLILDNPYQSLAAFGAQRTGKSYFLAVLSQELHRGGTKIYHINLASYGTEDDDYWCHCVRSVRGDLSVMSAYEANQLIDAAILTVEEFYSQENAILVFDEWFSAGDTNNAHAKSLEPLLKIVADKLSVLASTGIKRKKAIWTIAPKFVAKMLQPPALAIKGSQLLYITIAPGRFVDWNGNKIGFNEELFAQVKRNYPIYMTEQRWGCDRIAYINKEWIEIGDLPPLDPTLKPSVPTKQPVASTVQQKQAKVKELVTVPGYSEEEKNRAVAAMVAALAASRYTNLWEFVRDELGVSDINEIKAVMLKIAQTLNQEELVELQEKFRLRSEGDVRYSYPGYAKKVAATHYMTGNICCCCLEKPSEEAHHTRYLGIDDKAAVNLFPVCGGKGKGGCHDLLCHSLENWVRDRDNLWNNHNTPEWEAKLVAGVQLLSSQRKL